LPFKCNLQRYTVGLMVLSDPDFAEVDDLMRRIHSLLPQAGLYTLNAVDP
jgi:hypothetical protein